MMEAEELYSAADDALSQEKQSGRDRVVVARGGTTRARRGAGDGYVAHCMDRRSSRRVSTYRAGKMCSRRGTKSRRVQKR